MNGLILVGLVLATFAVVHAAGHLAVTYVLTEVFPDARVTPLAAAGHRSAIAVFGLVVVGLLSPGEAWLASFLVRWCWRVVEWRVFLALVYTGERDGAKRALVSAIAAAFTSLLDVAALYAGAILVRAQPGAHLL